MVLRTREAGVAASYVVSPRLASSCPAHAALGPVWTSGPYIHDWHLLHQCRQVRMRGATDGLDPALTARIITRDVFPVEVLDHA